MIVGTEPNSITYNDLPLMLGSNNYFTLRYGLKPSFGIFKTTTSVRAQIQIAQNNGHPLVFTEILPVTPATKPPTYRENKVTINGVWFVKATPLEKDLANSNNCLEELLLADGRVRWQHIVGTTNYNCYDKSRVINAATGTWKLDSSTCKANNVAYTIPEIINALWTLLGTGVTLILPSVISSATLPFYNVKAKGRYVVDVLQELFDDLSCSLCCDFSGSTFAYALVFWGNSAVPAPANTWPNVDKLAKGGGCVLNPYAYAPANVKLVIDTELGDSTQDLKLVTGSTVVSPTGGVGSELREDELAYPLAGATMIANIGTLATAKTTYAANAYASSFSDSTYWGLWAAKITWNVQEITWAMTDEGAYTRIKGWRIKPEPRKSYSDGLWNYGDYPVGASRYAKPTRIKDLQVAFSTDGATLTGVELNFSWKYDEWLQHNFANYPAYFNGSASLEYDGYREYVLHRLVYNYAGTKVLRVVYSWRLCAPDGDVWDTGLMTLGVVDSPGLCTA